MIGMLAVIYTQSNDADVNYFLLTCLVNMKKSTWHFETVSSGQYSVSVFTIEEGGLPFNRSAVKPKMLSIIREVDKLSKSRYIYDTYHQCILANLTGEPVGIIYDLHTTLDGVCITCNFWNNTATNYCVVIVHQKVSQLNSSGLVQIESSHKLVRSGVIASGCIEGVNLEDYQVGVIGATQQLKREESMALNKVISSVHNAAVNIISLVSRLSHVFSLFLCVL